MDWHISREQLQAAGRNGSVGQTLGWTGYTWNKLLFPDPDAVSQQAARRGPEDHAQSASGLGHPAVGAGLSRDGARHGHRSGDEEIRALRPHRTRNGRPITSTWCSIRWKNRASTSGGSTGSRSPDDQARRREATPGGSTTFTSPISSARASGRCSFIAGAAWAITATRSASPATPFPCGIRSPFSRGSRPPRPTWATPTGATTSAATCLARSIPNSSRAGCSSARSAPFCARTPPRIPIPSAASGPIPSRTRPFCARPSSFATRCSRTSTPRRGAPTTPALPSFIRSTTTGRMKTPAYDTKDEYMFGDQMLAAPVVAPADKVTRPRQRKDLAARRRVDRVAHRQASRRSRRSGPQLLHRPDSGLSARRAPSCPCSRPCSTPDEKPVDPLIVNVWPLAPGASSSYSVYEDSGVSVEYQRGVFARTPIHADANRRHAARGDRSGRKAAIPACSKTRGYELRLPADWPPPQ